MSSNVNIANPKLSLPPRFEGYPSLAEFIAIDGDAAIYRKFGHLSARNLLYMQSELHELEERLKELDQEDVSRTANDEAQKAARDWRHFSDPGNARAEKHRALQAVIRVKLKDYRAWSDAYLKVRSAAV